MPLPIDIDALLHGTSVEWERLEFKTGWNPLAVLHTLCAFANDFHNLGGGYLVLGVSELNGQAELPPRGLAKGELDTIQKQILYLGNSALQPSYFPIVVPYEIAGRHILVLWAPGGQTRPYKARVSLSKDNQAYAYFIRKGSSTVRARGTDEAELMSMAATVPFDDRLNRQARVEDLSRSLIQDFLIEVDSQLAPDAPALELTALGRQMNIVGGSSEALLPINVGLLFFNAEPDRFFPATQIDVVWFPDGAGGDKFTEKTFRGPLSRMVREALEYIRRNYLNETVIKLADRAEAMRVSNFPYEAVEEALVNAVYHRGYDTREPVEVRISPEDLVVLSYPGPDRSIRIEQLRDGNVAPRRYRNRRIGDFLKELDLTEGRATGIPKMLRAMRQNGSPPPEFDFDEDHSYFQVRLPVQPATRNADTVIDDRHVPEQVTEQVTEQVQRLTIALGGKESSSRELMELLGLQHRPSFLYDYLQPAIDAGFVAMTLPDKPRSSKQRYRITEDGRRWLTRHEESMKQSGGN
ncbi:MAG: RNA-binding domain-containing protein [Spirochaetota bacterium]